MHPWNSVQQFYLPKSITDLSEAHYCLSFSKTLSFCEFSFPTVSFQCTFFRTIPPTTLQESSLLDLFSVLQKMECHEVLASIWEFGKPLMEPLWVPEVLLLWFTENFHTQTCRQALPSTTRCPLSNLSALWCFLPSWSRSPGSSLCSPSECRALPTHCWIFSTGFSRYCSHQQCLHSLQQISLVNSRKILRQLSYFLIWLPHQHRTNRFW